MRGATQSVGWPPAWTTDPGPMDSSGPVGVAVFPPFWMVAYWVPLAWPAIGSNGEMLTHWFQPAAWSLCGASG